MSNDTKPLTAVNLDAIANRKPQHFETLVTARERDDLVAMARRTAAAEAAHAELGRLYASILQGREQAERERDDAMAVIDTVIGVLDPTCQTCKFGGNINKLATVEYHARTMRARLENTVIEHDNAIRDCARAQNALAAAVRERERIERAHPSGWL
jgi:hypothetical protein